jgi:ferrous iron transport protein A
VSFDNGCGRRRRWDSFAVGFHNPQNQSSDSCQPGGETLGVCFECLVEQTCSFVFIRVSQKKEKIMRTLKEVNIGETVKVVKITGEGPVKRRIMDMGITKGTEIYVRKVAPLGDPIEVTIRGYELSLRKADIDIIQVEDK